MVRWEPYYREASFEGGACSWILENITSLSDAPLRPSQLALALIVQGLATELLQTAQPDGQRVAELMDDLNRYSATQRLRSSGAQRPTLLAAHD